ncbi:MAG TPA: TIGR04282 family arsenosugar biosynthesis glycosyltransferase [Vicinamibacterales bacterium]|nr:TIGR04282 family arsenosugar biosynthesis glycosyltransferase [Vicinamibacterales bacterium]
MPAAPLAIALLGRAPSSPDAKTRLRQALPSDAGAALPLCLFLDTLEAVRRAAGGEAVPIVTPPDAAAELRHLMPDVGRILPQRGTDLGERMHHAFVDLFELGYGPVLLVGTDLPTLPPAHLTLAAEQLAARADRVVLGPAEDGGYYLIGLNRPERRLFDRIDWSTSRVFNQTRDAALRLGLDVCQVPGWHDVDTPEDLRRLAAELASLPPHVGRYVRKWMKEREMRNEE